MLKQPQYQPYPVEDQVISIYAGTKGYFDNVPTADVTRAEAELLQFMKDERERGVRLAGRRLKWGDDVTGPLDAALKEFFDRDKPPPGRSPPRCTNASPSRRRPTCKRHARPPQ